VSFRELHERLHRFRNAHSLRAKDAPPPDRVRRQTKAKMPVCARSIAGMSRRECF
jgi:hypothetical protein